MLLGALLDAGARLEPVVAAVEAVLPATVRLDVHEVHRAGMRATKVDVTPVIADHHHRNWSTIRGLLTEAPLAEPIRERALAVFAALARAEARVHGVEIEQVHFHEVGAWDSIADIVGVAAALHDLGITALGCGPVGLGSGTVRVAHGEIPVPVPAVVELAKGRAVLAGGHGELATPTGMALVAALTEPQLELPAGTITGVGVGAGTRDDPHRPNIVRVLLGDSARPGTNPSDAVVLEANVDDIDPRLWPGVLACLLAAGADDAWLAPILMKKGRPAHTLHVLCAPPAAGGLRDEIFRQVPTLGVRQTQVTKHALERSWVGVDVDGGHVRIKLALSSGQILTATPEFSDVMEVAETTGRPQRVVLAEAIAAAQAAGLAPGVSWPER